MKVIVILVFFMTFSVFGQQWKDSLIVAKNAYERGDYKRAYMAYLEAQRVAPEGVDLSKDIGASAYRSGDFKMADQAFRQSGVSETDEVVKAQRLHNQGNSKMKQEDYQGAIESYKQALRLNPIAQETRYNLAMAKRKLKQQEEQQNQQQDQDNNQEENNEKENSSSGNSSQNQQEQNSNQDKKESSNNNQQNAQNNKTGDLDRESEQQVSQKRTERLLDELLKQEMETQRKVQGKDEKGNPQQVKSGKRW